MVSLSVVKCRGLDFSQVKSPNRIVYIGSMIHSRIHGEYNDEGFDLIPISRALNSYVNIFNIYSRFWTNHSSI